MASVTTDGSVHSTTAVKRSKPRGLAHNYWPFAAPALVVVIAVIVFPWVFTIWMSFNRWTLGQSQSFVGIDNYLRLAVDGRFWVSLWHTVLYTALSVIAPVILGTLAALIFNAQFPFRGFCAASSSCP